MNDESWYTFVTGEALLQGDILPACPVATIAGPWSFPIDRSQIGFDVMEMNVIVMTQSCDLEHQKSDFVLLARVNDWRTTVATELEKGNSAIKSRDFRKKLIDGSIPGLSLLHKHDAEPKLDWSVVDFHRLFTLPKTFLEQYAKSLGPRLRLRSPYREHLAQAFARYFMRVGLPHDAKAFEKEGDVPVTS